MANIFDNIPETEPEKIIIGDTLLFKRIDLGADYPNGSYTLSYYARKDGAGSTEFHFSASSSGNDYLVNVAAATTAAYTAGTYRWQAYITRISDSARVTVDSGTWEVEANKATSTADPRSHAQIMLDKIESILENRADADVSSYSINGRSLSKLTITDLLEWRKFYAREVAAEKRAEAAANGKASGSQILVRFS